MSLPLSEPHQIDWVDVGEFVLWCWQLCCWYGGSVTGGCRTEKRNALVGGHEKSKHQFGSGWGEAIDIVFDTPEGRQMAVERTERERPEYHTYVGEHYEPTRLHVQGWKVGELPHPRELQLDLSG